MSTVTKKFLFNGFVVFSINDTRLEEYLTSFTLYDRLSNINAELCESEDCITVQYVDDYVCKVDVDNIVLLSELEDVLSNIQ